MKIALLQILPTGSLNGNREKGVEACRKAKALGADIALFPEMWSNGYDIPEDAEALQRAAVPADGEFVPGFGKLAAELNMAIAITFLEKTEKRPRNAVSLFDRHGRRLYTYAKVHTCDFGDERRLDAGEDFFTASLDTEEGAVQVGSMICYDREFPESARILMLKGAELILTPNACPMEINRLSQLRGRAYENMAAIATCNYPSPHPDCNGHSTVFDGVAYLPELSGSRNTCILEARTKGFIWQSWIWTCCGNTGSRRFTATPTAARKSTGFSRKRRFRSRSSGPTVGENAMRQSAITKKCDIFILKNAFFRGILAEDIVKR